MNRRDDGSWKIPIEKHTTAAWANITETKPVSKVAVPNQKSVRNAKDYVDANQK
ncbi:MAG: DUF3787 domain-containing protein [Clostridiales bacterium GWE2_32_10]|nr:MAG: DUF3787 domain-containing protein [Clostridiales bacterium GWE2_32_10]